MPPEVEKYLFDMRSAVLNIVSFTDGKTIADYQADLILRSAVERQFEIVGEALNRIKKVAPELATRFTEHQQIIGFRNVLIHGYDTVDDVVTWRIIQEKLPVLRRELSVITDDSP